MTKKDMLKCYRDLSTCDMDKMEHVVNAIYKAFDTDNDGTVGMKMIILCYNIILVWFLWIDFKEFVVGFLLTTKGTMEEKLDYTFQLYGMKYSFNYSEK
jgi:Ca2+-binding EF-hand superfamily protein